MFLNHLTVFSLFQMWRIVALTAVLHVLGGVSSKPLGSQQDPFLTPQGVTFEELVKQLRKVNDDELFRQRQPHRRLNLGKQFPHSPTI